MKKLYSQRHKNSNSKDHQVIHINSPAKKQFQLLYRERDPQLCSDAYQSIIFVKSKKCQNKSAHSKIITSPKHKKQSVRQMKKLIKDLQKQLKTQQYKLNSIEEQPKKNKIIKDATVATNFTKSKQIYEAASSKTSSRWQKDQKKDDRVNFTQKYQKTQINSKSKHLKVDQIPLIKVNKNIQFNQSKHSKSKQRKKRQIQELNVLDKLRFPTTDQYILLQDNFVKINIAQAAFVQQKLLSTRNNQHTQQRKSYNTQENLDGWHNNSPIYQQNQNLESQFHKFIEDEQSEKEVLKQIDLIKNPYNSIMYQSNIQIVQKYIVSKVKIIQRWFRKVIKKIHNQQRIKPELFSSPLQNSPQNQLNQRSSFGVESEDSKFAGNLKQICNSREPSPIKLTEQFYLQDKKSTLSDRFNDSLQIRLKAAQIQNKTHHEILENIYKNGKITKKAYIQKNSVIEAKYKNQLQQIQNIRKIIKQNTQRAYLMTQKTNEDLKIFADLQNSQVDSITLEKIFGKNNTNQQQEMQIEPKKTREEFKKNNCIGGRQKSTGCHFNSSQTIKPSIYLKTKENQQINQAKNDNIQDQVSHSQMINNNFQNMPPINIQFKQMLDEYKITQQIKMQIDKRAAIQMGVIIQQIPPQIKEDYVGIDTSLNSIHRFLLAFFKFYIFYYKDQFLRFINMPYGHNIDRRIKCIQGYREDINCPIEDQDGVIYGLESVISEEILDQFYEKVFDLSNSNMSNTRLVNFQFDKIHNRALFDSFNEALNSFRPYFLIDGPPYPWNNSQKALTFYFIAQENIQQVFEKSQFKVLKWSSTLCGILVNRYINDLSPAVIQQKSVEQILQIYRNSCHSLLAQTRQDRLNKNEKNQVLEDIVKWSLHQEEKTQICFLLSEYVFNQLMVQMFKLDQTEIKIIQQSF